MRDANLVHDATSPGGGAPAEEAFEERERRTQAMFERMAAGTLEEQQRIGAQMWHEHVERPRMARRIATARRPRLAADIVPRTGQRTRERRPVESRRTASSSSTSGSDPGDPDEPAPGWRWAHPAWGRSS